MELTAIYLTADFLVQFLIVREKFCQRVQGLHQHREFLVIQAVHNCLGHLTVIIFVMAVGSDSFLCKAYEDHPTVFLTP